MEIRLKVKELRKKSGLSQVDFAKRAGVGLRFVRDLEQGKKTVRVDKVNQALELFGYHLEVIKND
ncbi:helix-turn-helix transcriptional regulator [Candidatus Poribacteria bacterium]|nr:helix-turn-helix transcriptional regulator [Candidatus Poribacteria bacterium]